MRKLRNTIKPILTVAFILLITGCGPIHRFTRVKKIPREYSLNYCAEEIKAPRTDLNKQPWIVYSDRDKNQTFNNPGGKVKFKDVDYLDAFLVLKRKGDYLSVIKHTPTLLKNGKLDYKNAEYYGWMHKSVLLLNNQSVTDIATGKKVKTLAVFSDTLSVNEPEKYFTTDSILLYSDPELKTPAGCIAPYSIIYELKRAENENATLISRMPHINVDKAKEIVLGWVDNSLIESINTGLHVNHESIPDALKIFRVKDRVLSITEDMLDMNSMLTEENKTIKFNPVLSYSYKDTLVAFRTRMQLPVFDYGNNYIFNVNGGQITHKQYRSFTRNLKKINISFVFEGKENTISQFPQIVNALQNLQAMFEQKDENFSYQFNCILTFDEKNKSNNWPVYTELTSNYADVINFLADKANKKDKLQPISFSRNWPALHYAVDIFEKRKDETNLIVLIGDVGYSDNAVNYSLTSKLLKNNCRLVGFQVYAGMSDEYNNFVLDIENMINSYANEMLKKRKEILVSPEQIKRNNQYIQVGEIQNGYRLDFPDNSITQGALFFPQKSEYLPMEILSHNIDTIIQQIKTDNQLVSQKMSAAFRAVGNNRTVFDSLFVHNFNMGAERIPEKKFISSFANVTPGWLMPSKIILLNDSLNKSIDYHIMLSETEMNDVKDFITGLSKYEVEFISEVKSKKKQKRNPCNCPDDDLFLELEKEMLTVDGDNTKKKVSRKIAAAQDESGKYAATRKIRRHLTKSHIAPLKYCKLCKEKNKKMKGMTLAEAQFKITGCPTSHVQFDSLRIKDIKKKKRLPDEELDDLIQYYKKMIKELDKAEKFESNGESYYWVSSEILP